MSLSSESRAVDQFLRAARWRLRARLLLVQITLAGLVIACAAFFVLAGAATFPVVPWRAVAGIVSVLALVWAASRLRRGWNQFSGDEQVAQLLLSRDTQKSELLSALELGKELDQGLVLGVSPELIAALQVRVERTIDVQETQKLIDLRREKKRALVVAAAIAGLAFALGFWRPLWLGRALLALSGPPALEAAKEPIVADLKLLLTYPAYTKLPPRAVSDGTGQILALPGTNVEITATALIAPGRPEIVLDKEGQNDPQHIAATVEDRTLRAHFTVRQRGRYRFVLGRFGRRVAEPEPHRIELEIDRPPEVELYAPPEGELDGSRPIELGYSVQDDYGLSDVELVWQVGSGAPHRQLLKHVDDGARHVSDKFVWDVTEIEAPSGSRVSYYLEAKDNDTVPAAQVGRSRTFYLGKHDPAGDRALKFAEIEALRERALSHLADRLEADNDVGRAVQTFSPLHARAEEMMPLFTRIEALTKKGRLFQVIAEMHQRLGHQVDHEGNFLVEVRRRLAVPNHPRDEARGVISISRDIVSELERDVIALDDLSNRARLEELSQISAQMKEAEQHLRELMKQYAAHPSDAVKREIERQLAQLERRMAELQSKAARLASELPTEYLNREAIKNRGLQEELAELKKQLGSGDMSQAMAQLDRIKKSLDDLEKSLDSDMNSYRQGRMSPEDQAQAELENRISDLAKDEGDLSHETESLHQAQAKTDALDEKTKAELARANKKVGEAKKELEAAERDLSPQSSAHQRIEREKKQLDSLEKLLKEPDLDDARQLSEESRDKLRQLGDEMQMQERFARKPNAESRQHVEKSAQELAEIARQLDAASRQAPKPSPAVERQLDELSRRQAALEKQAGEMAEELGKAKSGQSRPSGGDEAARGLKQAGGHMKSAENELRGHNARRAVRQQEQALSELNKLSDAQKSERQRQSGRSGMDKEPVRIPGAEEYQAPKAFRQDLLEAMKRKAPAHYEEKVKRYYEELAK